MNARWGTWCLGQVWCHSPKLESHKKELARRKGGERCLLGDMLMISPWDHHKFVWECSRLTTIPNTSLMKHQPDWVGVRGRWMETACD